MAKKSKQVTAALPDQVPYRLLRIILLLLLVILSEIILISYGEFALLYYLQMKEVPLMADRAILFSLLIVFYVFWGLAFGFFLDKYLSLHVALWGALVYTLLSMFGSVPVIGASRFYILEYLAIPVFFLIGIYIYHQNKHRLLQNKPPEQINSIRKYSYTGMFILVFLNIAMIISYWISIQKLPGYQNMKQFQIPVFEGAESVKEQFYKFQGFKKLQFKTQNLYPLDEIVSFYDSALIEQNFNLINPNEELNDTLAKSQDNDIIQRLLHIYQNEEKNISVIVEIMEKKDVNNSRAAENYKNVCYVSVSVYPVIPKNNIEQKTDDISSENTDVKNNNFSTENDE
ncbi:MAG: hypothetical protein A2161_15605 [Candidatus Schekmanbacteria bacterium RBG_13_48_7]|uniref:Uncharacterized protein n=1 Tax=Candidatus Schekmanbacteria bacterium RBG_13_48_7 TaxID=1817878 RepID=A0A1F7RKI9_9BACT|nr:MAG: hypothetical protein A2161_15605 [Candidatus Schekmanbacteria bacterium RBG_13_48_7]